MIRINENLIKYLCDLVKSPNNNLLILQSAKPTVKIMDQGSKINSVFVIKSGIAKCYLTQDTGNDFIQEFFGEGEIFGEIEMFNNELSLCDVEAITDLVLFKISKYNFFSLIANDKKFQMLVLESLASKIKYKALRHSYNQSHTIDQKIINLHKQFPEIMDIIQKKDIANYLGITKRSLNRVISDLKKRNLI